MARIDIKGTTGGGGGGSGTVTSVGLSSSTLTVTNTPVTTSGTIVANIPDGYLKVGTGITGTLQNVVDTNGTATTLFLSSTAAQFTSPLRITTSDASGFYLDAEDSATNNRFSIKRDPSSQEVTLDFASNPTGSTTLVGAIRTYGDGVNLSNAMSFREDGNVGIGTDTPGAKLDIHSAGATVAQFNKTGSGNSYIQQLTAGAAKWKHGFTSASGAFDIIDDVNSLTRLSLLNTGQLKLNAYTSTSAFTGTTAGFLAFDSTGNILSVAAPGGGSPAGTTGAIQFNNAGAFGADSTNFFWDDTNNRLGVGTNAPTRPLTVVGSTNDIVAQIDALSNAYNTQLQLRTYSSNSAELLITGDIGTTPSNVGVMGGNTAVGLTLTAFGSNNIQFYTTNSFVPRFRINNDGNIGAGTTSPTAKMHIQGSGSTSATTSLLVQNSAAATALEVKDNLKVGMGAAFADGSSGFGVTVASITASYPCFLMNQTAGATSKIGFNMDTAKLYFSEETNGSTLFGHRIMADTRNGGFVVKNDTAAGATASLNASAVLQADSTTRGFLPPRMTTTQKNAITGVAGLMVYDTTLNKLCVYTTAWETITSI